MQNSLRVRIIRNEWYTQTVFLAALVATFFAATFFIVAIVAMLLMFLGAMVFAVMQHSCLKMDSTKYLFFSFITRPVPLKQKKGKKNVSRNICSANLWSKSC
jgi:hypothetical protein